MGPSEREPIDAVIAAHADELLAVDGVVGVGAGASDEGPTVEVLTDRDDASTRIPAELDGYPVRVRRTGSISKLEG